MNTNKDWKLIVQASGLGISADQRERIAGALQSLDQTFRPLVKDLPPELEPATGMRLEEEGE
jgi:hypothetical protein